MRHLCIICLGEDYAHSVLEGTESIDCEGLSMKKVNLNLPLFSRELGQASVPLSLGPAAAEAQRRKHRRLLDVDVLSLETSDIADRPLLTSIQ